MKHVMLDLETLGTSPGSVIMSMGAVEFCTDSGQLGREFYTNVDRDVSESIGMTVDDGTVNWWKDQSREAWDALAVNPLHPALSAMLFANYFKSTGADMIWSHGASFDVPLTEALFSLTSVETPWKFWNIRCTRTIYEAAGNGPDRSKGTHHNALDDAKNQAEAVIRSFQILKARKA